jgi:hypothetical protein
MEGDIESAAKDVCEASPSFIFVSLSVNTRTPFLYLSLFPNTKIKNFKDVSVPNNIKDVSIDRVHLVRLFRQGIYLQTNIERDQKDHSPRVHTNLHNVSSRLNKMRV